MPGIASIAIAREAFPDLKWRSMPTEHGEAAFAIVGGNKERGDITVLLAMENGAQAPRHSHRTAFGWPFCESTTCLAGEMHGMRQGDPGFVLMAGQSIDINNTSDHAPFVPEGKFALVVYRQPKAFKTWR